MKSSSESTLNEKQFTGKGFDLRLIKGLLVYLEPHTVKVSWLMLISPVAMFLSIYWIMLVKIAIDGPIAQGDVDGLYWLVGELLLVVVVSTGLQLLTIYLSVWVGQRAVNAVRIRVFEHMQSLSLSFYDRNPVGRLMTRVVHDVDALSSFFQEGVVPFVNSLWLVIFIMTTMLMMHVKLACIVFVALPFIMWASFAFKKRTRYTFRESRLLIARVNAYLQENISGIREVQCFNREEKNAHEFYQRAEDYRNATFRSIFYFSIFFPLMEFVAACGLCLAIGGGAYYFYLGLIEPKHPDVLSMGALVSFILLAGQFFSPIREMAEKYNTLQAALASCERVSALLEEQPEIVNTQEAIALQGFRGEIEFRNVSFAYVDERWVIEDLSFKIAAGEKVAFVGHTGAGKSTLIALLFRFYDIQKGQILLDGRDIRSYTLESLRQNMGMVLQSVFLFRDSILENIRLGRKDISLDKVQALCRYVRADEFIQKLPDGYNTQLEERGSNLSVGQRQLLSMARALAFEPNLLILDEATSNIDTETEAVVQLALTDIIKDKNVIVIAHRLSTVEDVDKIFVLSHGKLVESGTHAQLLAQPGVYNKLYQLQYPPRQATS